MPKAASFSPLQLFAPIQLGLCLLLFFLPWIDIQCVPPPSEVKNMPKEQVEMVKKEIGIDPTKPITLISQSGLQIANGTASVGSDIKKATEKMTEKMSKQPGVTVKSEKSADSELNESLKKEKDVSAPLLWVYLLAVIAGIAVGFIPWASVARKLIVAGCCALAFGLVGIQAAMGFPLENKMKEKTKGADGGAPFKMPGMGGMGGMGGAGGGGGGKADPKASEMQRVSWQIPLYLTFVLLLGAGGTAFLGASGGGKKAKRKAYNFDDDDEDEDDRPRKKRRRDEDADDDDEDRPRKKKEKPLSLDDEEEESPKKKRPVDDDEEEPQPKKAAPPAPAPAGGNPFDFGDDDAPKKKPKRRDDEDDRPRKKRRRDDDD